MRNVPNVTESYDAVRAETGRQFVTYRRVTPHIGSGAGQTTVPTGDLPEYQCRRHCGTSKALEILRKSSRKGVAAANRMPLKTRVATKTAWVFQKVCLTEQSGPPTCHTLSLIHASELRIIRLWLSEYEEPIALSG
jgi:hypothetical protein